jgi:beta-glucosidase-like glycosyl hydrolase
MRTGRLLFPALRWEPGRGFEDEAETIEAGLSIGVGGFILFGGEAGAVRDLVEELRARSPYPLLIGADLERGAGQQFEGATRLPPVAALGALDDLETTRRAGELTAREALALGVNWVYAPVADIDVEPRNPIVGSRSFGGDPERVAAHVAAWIEGCRAAGALACAKHFPGHGRTVADSHAELPRVEVERPALEMDLLPFRAAVDAGVDSVMTAHVAYPALDPTGEPATLSHPIVTGLLRGSLGFDGLVVTDALIMEGVLGSGWGEAGAVIRALAAGCDALLYPRDLRGVAEAVEAAVGRELPADRVEEAIGRIERAAARVAGASAGEWGGEADRRWALDIASRSLVEARGRPTIGAARAIELLTIDDDVGGPYPPGPRDVFPMALRRAGLEVRDLGVVPGNGVAVGTGVGTGSGTGPGTGMVAGVRPTGGAVAGDEGARLVIALYVDIRAWKGRPGLSAGAREAVARAAADRPDAVVVLFGHPRLAMEVPGASPVLAAWGGESLMQEAAARRLGDRG